MPIPIPNKGEDQNKFIGRCINAIKEEFNDPNKTKEENNKQRVGVCFSQWRKNKKIDSVDSIKRSFKFNIDKQSNLKIDPVTGFLYAKARLTRSGVFDYYDNSGNLIREFRPDEEVFDKESIESLELKPITNDHPDQLVTADNIKLLQIGSIGENIVKDGIFLSGNIIITDKDMIETIVNRKKTGLQTELSCGYSCNIVSEMGIHDKDGYYTAKQEKIRYNHVGIVDKARAGKEVKILDSQNNNKEKEHKVAKIQFTRKAINCDSLKLDQIKETIDEESLKLVNTLSDKLDESEILILSYKKDRDELQGKYDQANETIKLQKEKIDSLSSIDSPIIAEMANKRRNIEDIAKKLKVDCKDKDMNTIICDCIKAVSKDANLENKSQDYINARYDSIVEMVNSEEKNDSNNRFYNFMKIANDSENNINNDPRKEFINKDKEQNRK
jgi:hypothetical protein